MEKPKKGRPRKIEATQIPPEPEPQVIPQAPVVTISLKIGDRLSTSTGVTVFEALRALPKPDKIAGKGVLTLSLGNLSRTQMFFPARLKRLFYNKHFQEIQAKYLAVGLKSV